MPILMMRKPILAAKLLPPFDTEKFPSYENTTLTQRQEIWKEYKAFRRLENASSVLLDQSSYSYVQEQLNIMYRDYISKFSTTALSKENCF